MSGAVEQSPQFGMLQEFVDRLYRSQEFYSRLEVIMEAEAFGLEGDLMEIIELLPPTRYHRDKLCGQINSALSSHGWGYVYGAVH